jgi:hypothetical protein
MIAAIYARKSTDQDVSDEEKSVARKISKMARLLLDSRAAGEEDSAST